ncbi:MULTISPECIES: ABC transporter permease [unclassified Roseiflexus]|jgi:fluoroquinolone transport system permease protein|uniref:ABC transporter permease n=1 Tax=unclassified Roseiflexus TaxID=2609473 RepID=UPI0000D7FBD9|nr:MULTISPECIES: ABC transporter permease [unclassified Roseiflexus]ABQ92185.1 ABC-2 type transporter [Roseiflexus sp. RS-1]MBO9322405.1 ABC transporter permease [Roseiflexus sp.]MCL6541786.1 ABC transporter permease [Roseiflexus sp.]
MKRFAHTLYWDMVRQYRNGFYLVSAFVVVLMALVLRQIGEVDWSIWWPPLLLENLVINAFYFMAGIVLLEKSEGVLEAQIVTPLRDQEYLLAKVVSLFVLSVIESLALILIVSGPAFNWFWMLLGIAGFVALYAFYGFFVVSRYDSITEFLMPSALWTLGFSLPLLSYFDLWRHWSLYLHPLQAPLLLIHAAYTPLPAWQMAYAILYTALWVGIGAIAGQRAFYRFVIAKEGVRKP